MSPAGDTELRRLARAVLERNHRDGYTIPAEGLYPFQWCWDSGPIALGWAAAGRWDRAWQELERLFSAQWPTGMVPHIVFWREDDGYFPGPEVWATGRNPADHRADAASAPGERCRPALRRVTRIGRGPFPPFVRSGRTSTRGCPGSNGRERARTAAR